MAALLRLRSRASLFQRYGISRSCASIEANLGFLGRARLDPSIEANLGFLRRLDPSVEANLGFLRCATRVQPKPIEGVFKKLWKLATSRYAAAFGLAGSVGVHTFRYQGGDYLAQAQEPQAFDVKRSLAFVTFGAYCGTIYYYVYGSLYTLIMQRFSVPALAMVFFDLACMSQVVYFPAYYVLQEVVRSPSPSVGSALAKYDENRWNDVKALMTCFIPIHFLNYSYVPTPWRGFFSGAAGIVWAIYLSQLRGNAVPSVDVNEEPSKVRKGTPLEVREQTPSVVALAT